MLVLGLATSHAPTMLVPVEQWSLLYEMLVDGVPQPPSAAAETPATNAAAKQRIDDGLARLRQVLADARPDALVIIGDDQDEVFGPAFNPTLAVLCADEVSGNTLPRLRNLTATDQRVHLKGHSELARHLAAGLVERGFDPAVISELRPLSRPDEGIGHAFTRPAHALGIADLDIRVVPVFLNAYRDPLPTGQRCYALGQAIREIADGRPERIAVCASGGLSHDPRGPRAGWIDQRLDTWVLSCIAQGRAEKLTQLFTVDSDTLRGGTGEIRSWITVAGAFAGQAGTVVDYIPLHHAVTGLGLAHWHPSA
ncbi:hypothetical protein [Pseudonocardia acidicola]|uniref:Extradiol ring-cleavage dioxygenase class III enzyme subunit B domain-containing protein n=1 Tax=Pseudonocardia acidicola TaxID=2724939 RepID=A0ABX1SAH1_9PSEU|nr:hypothetical protein [Pseudonocardia acidicola]NMH97351.1 hypothetical protein [Pseudonocardia acidicola]